MYELNSENLTALGGPMGSSEHTWSNFRKYYSTMELAKEAAEKDYGKKLQWIKTKTGFRTKDLGYVMYHIKELKVEK